MTYAYSVYGLQVSAESPLPGLIQTVPQSFPDGVQVWMRCAPDWVTSALSAPRDIRYVSADDNDRREPTLMVWTTQPSGHFYFRYADGTEFVVERSGREVWTAWPESLTLEDTATYLIGPVLNFVLRLRGVTCLHASAVVSSGRAIVLPGPAGAGKSTVAAAFALGGTAVLSDDVAVLDDEGNSFRVQPGYPRLNLWPASAEALCASAGPLPKITPNWDKRYLDLSARGLKFEPSPLPLAAIYLLGRRTHEARAPYVEEVPPREGLLEVVANAYLDYLLDGPMRARDFEVLGRVQACVPIRRIIPHADPARLPQLCQALLDDFRSFAHPAFGAARAPAN